MTLDSVKGVKNCGVNFEVPSLCLVAPYKKIHRDLYFLEKKNIKLNINMLENVVLCIFEVLVFNVQKMLTSC